MAVATIATALLPAASALAQGREFTRQAIYVNSFEAADLRTGRLVASALRSRIQRLYSRRDVITLGSSNAAVLFEGSGMDHNRPLQGAMLTAAARALRADEIVSGSVQHNPDGSVRIAGRLSLVRDERLVEPIPAATAPTVDSAATLFARAIDEVREQLPAHRRCENFARNLQFQPAIDAARTGLQTVTKATLLHTCLLTSLIQISADAGETLREARAVLAVTPNSYWAIDGAARAYDALGDRALAAEHWLRLAATDSFNVDLGRRVLGALVRGGNARPARPLAARLARDTPDDVRVLRLRWQAHFALREWAEAATLGSRLLDNDAESRDDSTFVLQLATATRMAGDTVKAVAMAATGVVRFPGDSRLYMLYTEAVQREASVAAGRGAQLFPEVAELQLLHAQELRQGGRGQAAVASLRRALARDSTLDEGYLLLAQAQVEQGEPDSALVSVHRALAAGDDSLRVAQFALARGNAMYRAANDSLRHGDFLLAMRFLAFADSLHSTPQSQLLFGASALAVAQTAATDAPRLKDCALTQLANTLIPVAREKLTLGAAVAPDAVRQYLEYLDQLEPVVGQQVASLCPG
ncbi:MAG: hypothetical protein IT360_11960 [Gemmatimonadaceae bacterium]|nr:hypothetical protein [Gemmatimonadaceae bacterium]